MRRVIHGGRAAATGARAGSRTAAERSYSAAAGQRASTSSVASAPWSVAVGVLAVAAAWCADANSPNIRSSLAIQPTLNLRRLSEAASM